ncbi:MAG: hypothetical protein PHQ34_04445 [Methanothrix sp.]|nr:hypothetical protein [Methanothrix sp.]
MKITGKFKDIILRDGKMVADNGWTSNTIVVDEEDHGDCGSFLVALVKKEFNGITGINYMVVGSGSKDYKDFKDKISKINPLSGITVFQGKSPDNWFWATEIKNANMDYLEGPDGNEVITKKITNKLEIRVTFGKDIPVPETLYFGEFALIGSDGVGTSLSKIFFINYVNKGIITKLANDTILRTVHLTFLG